MSRICNPFVISRLTPPLRTRSNGAEGSNHSEGTGSPMAERHFDHEALRTRLLDALGTLSDEEHLEALRRITAGDYDIVLTDASTVSVELGRHIIEVPVADVLSEG